jgi:hypothetical protein
MSGRRSWFFYPSLSPLRRTNKKMLAMSNGKVIVFRQELAH